MAPALTPRGSIDALLCASHSLLRADTCRAAQLPGCSNDADLELIGANNIHDGENWMVSADCQSCFEDATGDDAATAACYQCTPPTDGCVCTVAEIMSMDAGVSAGCWSCAAQAGDTTGAVCGGATCGDDCTCSAADTAILAAEGDACSESRDSCVGAA